MSTERSAASSARPALLRPALKRYDWGDSSFIAETIGLEPQRLAEAWYGAHPAGPAEVEGSPLDAIVAAEPEAWLGAEAHRGFGEIPYLVKLLAAERPLSIQVHPNQAEARRGFEREDRDEIPRDAPHRSYRDPNHKPELMVARTRFSALAGFLPPAEQREALAAVPEIGRLLPPLDGSPESTRRLLEAWYELSEADAQAALTAARERLSAEASEDARPESDPARWFLFAARKFSDGSEALDRGLLFVFLLQLVHLEPRQAIFLPAGVPHAYLCGAGVEVMAASDNVLRAGLTSKPVRPSELLDIVRFDARAPTVLEPVPVDAHTSRYPTRAPEFQVERVGLQTGPVHRAPTGPETLMFLAGADAAPVRLSHPDGALEIGPGQVAIVPPGEGYRIEGAPEHELIVVSIASEHDPRLAVASAVARNVAYTDRLIAEGGAAAVVGTVSGTSGAQRFWDACLEDVKAELKARTKVSLHEDLPVNQAFGILLMWQRLQPLLRPGEGALMAFVFGEGSRAAPWTEAELGQKPAIRSFARMERGEAVRRPSIVELALRYFCPVEAYLRRSGFDGVLIKWGDEVQIPTLDLSGVDRRLGEADIVRFVSLQVITEDTALNKDWVGVDSSGAVTAFIPRRPIEQMEQLADRGLFRRDRDGQLLGGVNLGSIAMSRSLLDALHAEFESEINDPSANRKSRPDLDPQLFTALCIAARASAEDRAAAWAEALSESPAMARLEEMLPGVLGRLRGVLERLEAERGRPLRIEALDFGEQYWGDVGQHPKIFEFFAALADDGPDGFVARSLGRLDGGTRDSAGNWRVGRVELGPDVDVRDSVLVDVRIRSGTVRSSVLIGTQAPVVNASEAFDVESVAPSLDLAARAGTYRVVSETPVALEAGMRATTVPLESGLAEFRVHESANLRDRSSTYDVAIEGNPLSFAEAHAKVMEADPERLEGDRAERREALLRDLFG